MSSGYYFAFVLPLLSACPTLFHERLAASCVAKVLTSNPVSMSLPIFLMYLLACSDPTQHRFVPNLAIWTSSSHLPDGVMKAEAQVKDFRVSGSKFRALETLGFPARGLGLRL